MKWEYRAAVTLLFNIFPSRVRWEVINGTNNNNTNKLWH